MATTKHIKSIKNVTINDVKKKVSLVHPNIEVLSDDYDSNFKIKLRCKKHDYIWHTFYESTLNSKYGCKECFADATSGENSVNWNGGTTSIFSFLRRGSDEWKRKALKNYKKCFVTGYDKKLEVHHDNPSFKVIAKRTFENTGIDIKTNVSDYSGKELKTLLKECKRLHKFCKPLVLNELIHKEFHSKYKYPDNSMVIMPIFTAEILTPYKDESVRPLGEKAFIEKARENIRLELDEYYKNIIEDDNNKTDNREGELTLSNNNFYGSLHGVTANDFFKCLDRGIKTYEDRLESVNKMFYPDGKLHPFWSEVFEQPEGSRGHINLLLNSTDSTYSESNIANVLNSVGTYLLEPFMNEDDDSCDYKIVSDYKMYKESIRHASIDGIYGTDESEEKQGFMEMDLVEKNNDNYLKVVKQVIRSSDFQDPEIGRELTEYRKISDEIVKRRNMIRDLSNLTKRELQKLDDMYRVYMETSTMGIPNDNIWWNTKEGKESLKSSLKITGRNLEKLDDENYLRSVIAIEDENVYKKSIKEFRQMLSNVATSAMSLERYESGLNE